MISYLLVLLGLFLIFLEFYLPGAILGIMGGVSVLLGVILFASSTSSFFAIALFIAGTAIAVGLLIRFALWRIVHAKPDYSIYSDANQEGFYASTFDKSLIGKSGIVVADLKPGGYIAVEGGHYPAISQSGYVVKGDTVLVIGGQEQSLIVTKEKKEL